MMVTKFQMDAMSRADIPEKDRTDFYLYVDEFQNFATDSFATILSEARKYKLNLVMANQYIDQMTEEVR
jgi:type IV secretory pathway TraG/TraD family ATPase VirD4